MKKPTVSTTATKVGQRSRYFDETLNLVQRLIAAGCPVVSASNGGEADEDFTLGGEDSSLDAFVGELTAADEAWLRVQGPDQQSPSEIYIVYGNSPGELCCDHTTGSQVVTDAVEAHSASWFDGPPFAGLTNVPASVTDSFSESELITILEIARVACTREATCNIIASELDIADDDLNDLNNRVTNALNK